MAEEFDTAFAQFASPEPAADKKPDDAAAAAASDAGGAAAGGAGDGQGAGGDPDSGSGSADAGAGDGAPGTGGDAAAAAGTADGGEGGEAATGAAAGDKDGGAPGGDPGTAPAGEGKEAPAAQGDAGPSADDILAGLKKLVGEAKPAAAEPEAAAPAAAQPTYTQDEVDRLAKYDEDWKEVAECEALKRRAEYQALLQHVFTQVANFVKPIQETADALAQRTFTSDVKGAVPDYSDQLRADVIAWVKTQPTYLQVAYNHVIEEGTVDEVKDLVDRFRVATGKAAKPAGAGEAAPKQPGRGNELSDEAKKAAVALAPVDSKRSGVQQPGDPSSFDDAWREAAAGLG